MRSAPARAAMPCCSARCRANHRYPHHRSEEVDSLSLYRRAEAVSTEQHESKQSGQREQRAACPEHRPNPDDIDEPPT